MSIFGRQPGQPRYDGELHNLQVTESVFATPVPIILGTIRVHGKLLDYAGFKATKAPSGGKGIFGGKNDQFDYYADVIILLGQSGYTQAIGGVINVWDQNGKLENLSGSFSYTIPGSSASVQPTAGTPAIQYDLGVTKQVSYSVTANDYGSGGSRTLTGTQTVALTKVSGTPSAGQYSFNPTTSTYTFSTADAGTVVSIQYSTVFSLYYFEAVQPAVIPTTPHQVTTDNASYFQADQGVYFIDNGTAGIPVGGTPSATNEYHEGAGTYTFYAGDQGRSVLINYEYYSSDPDLTNSSSLNLTFFNGALSQAAWSYWASKYPGDTYGYSTLAYVGANPMALGESAALPSYNYETLGLCIATGQQFDADVSEAITLLLTDPFCGVGFPSGNLGSLSLMQAYLNSNNFFISQNLTSASGVGQTIQRWLEAGNVAAFWSEGLLKFVPYGDTTTVGNGFTYTPPTTPVVTLTYDQILPWTDKKTGEVTNDDPIQFSVKMAQDCYNYVQVQWTNRLNDYNNDLMTAQNDAFIAAYRIRMEPSQTWDFLTTQAAVSWALQLRLNRSLYIPETGKFYLPFTFSYLEPMDMVVLPTGEPVRILEVNENEDGSRLEISFENFTYGSNDVSVYTKQPPNSYQPTLSQEVPGNTSAYIFEATPQSVLAAPQTIQLAVAGSTPAWGGCQIYVSTDGTDYSPLGEIIGQNRTGLLSAALPSNPDPDTTDTLSVDMTISGGELVSVTMAQADSFVTLSAIADPSGSLELISFETATLTAANRYNLTYLRRGVYGTTIGAHAIGAEFSYLGSTGIFEYQYPAQYAGKTLYFKFPAFNLVQQQLQQLSACQAFQFTVPGSSLQPPSTGNFTTVPTNVLTAQASGSTAQITVAPFEAFFNNQSVACLPLGPYVITGLNQVQAYQVYYIDLAFAGGAITPIATQNSADYLGKTGYYYLGTITTPQPSGSSTIYRPTNYNDTGNATTLGPQYAYDSDPNTEAQLEAYVSGATQYQDICEWYVFANITLSGAATLYVRALYNIVVPSGTASITLKASLNGGSTFTNLVTASSGSGSGPTTSPANGLSGYYTLTVPGGTNLSMIQIVAECNISASPGTTAAMGIQDIYVQ
jgi:Putative phage tail protein